MSSLESVLYWAATLLLAVGFFATLVSLILKRPALFTVGRAASTIAFVFLTAFGIIRWLEWSHPPFVTLFESMITSIWFVLLMYLLFSIISRKSILLVLPVSLISFLMMGWSSSLPREASALSAALASTWLFIHASFATAGAASFIIGASFAVIYLMGEKKVAAARNVITAIPVYGKIIPTLQKMLMLGLVFWGVMIVSGSIWAHIAWGRYWAWDPIELWSLISWLLYGLLLHARLTFRIHPRLFCYLAILAALIIAFSLWGVQYVYETIHTYG